MREGIMNGAALEKKTYEDTIRRLYEEITVRTSKSLSFKTAASQVSPGTFMETSCLKNWRQFFLSVEATIPDYKLSLEAVTCKEDAVMVRYFITGKNESEFGGVLPSTDLAISGIDIFKIDQAKIVDCSSSTRQVTAVRPELESQTLKGKFSSNSVKRLDKLERHPDSGLKKKGIC
jgi:hypothetical protein